MIFYELVIEGGIWCFLHSSRRSENDLIPLLFLMCSINGVYSLQKNLSRKDILTSQKIQKLLNYRGPDYSGKFVGPKCALFSNVFSIVERGANPQPFYSDDKKIVLIFNGEIYNHPKLRVALKNKGYTFKTNSDTEVIMRSYEEYGDNCFKFFKGMFAIAIYDNKKGKLLLAKDRFGEKPLFYLEKDKQLYFSSESLPLVDLTDKKIDKNALAEYFALGFCRDHIIYGIKRLPAGSYLSITENRLSIKKYWQPNFNVDYNIDEKTATNKYEKILSEVIKEMYPQEVKVGSFLSGGIDSTTISLLLQNYKKTDCISSGLSNAGEYKKMSNQDSDFCNVEKTGNEFDKVEKIAKKLKINLYKKEFTIEKFIKDFDNIVSHLPGGPVITTSPPLWYFAANEAKKLNKRTVFAGEGADELFCGYKTNNPTLYLNSKHNLTKKYSEIMGLCNHTELKSLLRHKFNNPFTKTQSYLDKTFRGTGKSEDILMNKLRYMLGSGLIICPHMLEKADGMTMAYPVEVRLPYLHPDSVDFLYSLPVKFIINKNYTKILLRKVAKKIGVPDFVINEPKQRTFLPYYKLFFNSKYSKYFQEKILSKDVIIKKVLNASFVDKMAMDSKNPRKLLSLLILESYLRLIYKKNLM